jgi:hypothetical protein
MLTRDDFAAAAARGPADPRELAGQILGFEVRELPGPGGTLRIAVDYERPVTLAELAALARAFLTERIEVQVESDGGYYAGEHETRVWIRLDGIMAELAWLVRYVGYLMPQRMLAVMRNGIITEEPC